MSPSRTLLAHAHLRPDLAVLLISLLAAPLVSACASGSKDLKAATPPGELPALILPEGLLSDGTTPAKVYERRQPTTSTIPPKTLPSADDPGSEHADDPS